MFGHLQHTSNPAENREAAGRRSGPEMAPSTFLPRVASYVRKHTDSLTRAPPISKVLRTRSRAGDRLQIDLCAQTGIRRLAPNRLQQHEAEGKIAVHISENGVPAMSQYRGVVSWFDNAKGFGFLGRDGGPDVFCHYSAIQREGYKTLSEGDLVTFDIAQGQKGPQAENVVVVNHKNELNASAAGEHTAELGN